VISNDPDDPLDPEDDTVADPAAAAKQMQLRQRQERIRLDADDGALVPDFLTPITAFANTRAARGTHAVAQLRTALFNRMPGCPAHVAHVRVWPQAQETSRRSRAVSMSWWLSTPIQRHLHQQTEGTRNQNDNDETLQMVWRALRETSACAGGR
jgi:hypothetical protein